MCRPASFLQRILLVGLSATVFSACDKVSLPRLGYDTEPEPRLPLNITYAFSKDLLQYTKSTDACGLPYSIPVGNLIAKTFMEIGLEQFQTVQAEPPVGNAQGAPPDGYRIRLELQQFNFDPVTRLGEETRYQAFVDMKMQAVYEDAKGTALAKSPLVYHEKVNIWTPELSSQSVSCNTIQIDGTVEDAAETLAKQMASVLPSLAQPNLGQQPVTGQGGSPVLPPQMPAAPAPPPAPTVRSPSVQFRTKLVDANRNLVLEGGEAVVLLIETTNVGESEIPSSYVELRGTPVLVEAFKRVAPIPVPIGPLKPGEKRTAEIRGRLDRVTESLKGELIVGIILSEGLPPGTHTIRAEIQPGPRQKTK